MTEISPCEIIVGVDTHKDTHAAVAINTLGARLGAMTIPVSTTGYRDLEAWARSFGPIRAFGIEGTGSYGAGLSRPLQAHGHPVFEVNRPNRQLRHQYSKSDPLNAESAARAVLGGQATALPKSSTTAVEMIRHLKIARDTAGKGRTQAMLTEGPPCAAGRYGHRAQDPDGGVSYARQNRSLQATRRGLPGSAGMQAHHDQPGPAPQQLRIRRSPPPKGRRMTTCLQ